MYADHVPGQRLIPRGGRLARTLVLVAFVFSVLNLPVHLVHHLGEANPDCQLLGLSVSLSSSILDHVWSPTIDRTWDALSVRVLLPSVSRLGEFTQARAPPPADHS
jgi:hypothetical protein